MPNQIVLSWDVDVEGTPYGSAKAAAALAAVPLYENPNTDPVLGQFFGLRVADDQTTEPDASTARRTLTLDMFLVDDATPAPPPFPCHPRTSTPPELPYLLRRAVTLDGSFFVENGLTFVATAQTQRASLTAGTLIQFMSQQGVFYEVATIGDTAINLMTPYTGVTSNTTASKEVVDPATIVAIFSTSNLDTNGVATDPAIPAGPGARTVHLEYTDSDGTNDGVVVQLTGRHPALVALEPGTIDIAQIDALFIGDVGAFGNSVGQITVVALSATPSSVLRTAADFLGPATDAAQLLIDRHLAYIPPSYFALSQQGASWPALGGDFYVTTGSKNVPTTVDQTGQLAAGNTLEFAAQPGTVYTVADVSERVLKLMTVYTGIDTNHAGEPGNPNINAGTQGNLGTAVQNERTDARRLSPHPAASPTNAQLATPLAEFVAPETAAPPPAPPLSPSTVPTPTFLSGLFTRQIRLALRGAQVTANEITFI